MMIAFEVQVGVRGRGDYEYGTEVTRDRGD